MTREEFFRRLPDFPGVRAAARALGVNESTALNWSASHRKQVAPAPEAPQIDPRAAQERQDELVLLRKQLREAHRADITAERIRTEVMDLAAAADPDLPAWVLDPEKRHGSGPGVPVTQWSDWHFQEVIRAAETGGANAFDAHVARRRVQSLVSRLTYLCFEHMVNPSYPGIVVVLGGDMITGEIHGELADSNDLTTPQGILEVYDCLLPSLRSVADHFKKVLVVGVAGNHARDSQKPRKKRYVARNFDWLLYCLVERALKDDDRFTFLVPEGTDQLFRVYGHRFMATHGDNLGVKGGDGIIGAIGPIMRGRMKVHTSEAQIGRDFDTLLLHHWHQSMMLPQMGLMVNGALIGYNEFARLALRARFQPASQNLFFVHPRRGITCAWPIVLQDTVTDTAAPWTSWKD